MKQINNQTFDAERALYASDGLCLTDCAFDGPADGESALKESAHIEAVRCYCNLRYPFWHNRDLTLKDCELTPLCRAALWYSEGIRLTGCKLHGIKALRECRDVALRDCDIVSPEFGWSVSDATMESCTAESEYFMLRSDSLTFRDVRFKGKYSFQYIRNSVFDNCIFDTKDAFWHAENVTVRNCDVRGEYLAWYSDHLMLINCRISGTQPFCYCRNLKLIDCELTDADLCFEKSEVEATLTSPVVSIKNPHTGHITLPALGELILDDPAACCEVRVGTAQ